MLDQELVKHSVEKVHGVYVDEHVNPRWEAAAAAKEANQILGLIKRIFIHLDSCTLPLLYKALVRPHPDYGNKEYGPQRGSISQSRSAFIQTGAKESH